MSEAPNTRAVGSRPRRRGRLWLGRALLVLISLGLAGGVAELVLRGLGYTAIYAVYSRPSILWRHDPLLGWHHEPNTADRYVGPRPWPIEFETEIAINSLGLRGPEIEPVPEGGKRVLFLGDSVVAGFEVEQDETFVARTGERLTRTLGYPVQSLNGGVRGYGTDQTYLWYREHGKQLAPDWVVFVHAANDPRNNMTLHRMRRPFGKAAFSLDEGGELDLVGAPVQPYPLCSHWAFNANFQPTRHDGWMARSYCWIETHLTDHSALFTWITFRVRENSWLLHKIWYWAVPDGIERVARWFVPGVAHAANGGDPNFDASSYRLTSRLIEALAREVRSGGGRLLIVVRESELERMDAPAIHAEGARTIALAVTPEQARGRPIRFENDGHLNALGHRIASRLLAEAIRRELVAEPAASGQSATGVIVDQSS
ncbi:MAG: SGNH/GDSL hydrolase family protein [Myxococcota bacterium]|nr:SGNH/GDSL hydrolase family protein [Myxococcota bacterium]